MDLILLIALGVGALACAGAVVAVLAVRRASRQRRQVVARRLLSEQRLSAATSATLAAMGVIAMDRSTETHH